ncbi:hypothetical protein NQ317_015120 [Molorchus minor]|uniref:DNA helicase MCM9 n=1 Tax=Molorchus minor TaxID=1323400 RepID=A0ABQ9K7Y1_9CUCU|nr:hypothetical protein NQ317_015120 [Molorchus minor]
MCEDYLINFHRNEITQILQDEDISKHFSININFIVFYEHQLTVVSELLKNPEKCLEEWDRASIKAQMAVLKDAGDNAQIKNNVHCRMYLPRVSTFRKTIFPGNDDAGNFLHVAVFTGTVMRISAAKLLEYQRNYICVKCKHAMLVKAEYDRKYIIKQPKKCENPEGCSSTNLITFGELDSDNCKDYQEIKIQEQVKQLGVGCMPNTMWVTLEDDLVDSCKPGDNVTICGIVKRRWGEFSKGCKIDIDIVLKANHVQVDNNSSSIATVTPEVRQIFTAFWEKYSSNPLMGRDMILKSFCPQIYGLYLVKLAIAIVLAGGSHLEDTTQTGVHTRSESHILLVGDPGTGKSQLLRFASKIISRSVLTTGVGSTAAGLTVTALMEHGEWQLEGGALVMSDGGICCIDEFNSMKEHDRTSIHEAMEQQTISVAKASMVCKLNTRCSILAACNPKANLDPSQPLCMSIALPSPLLSRFDLILLLKDSINVDWDVQVADYILNGGCNISKLTDSGLWSVEVLQSYFTIIRKLNPKLSENAERILSAYYHMQRRIDGRNKARTTVRLLESLVRLSQGHARLMYHEEVETIDSIYAIVLIDAAMEYDASILDLNMSVHSVLPEYPTRDYRRVLGAILGKLGLQTILNEEIERLDMNKQKGGGENVRSRFFNRQSSGDDLNQNVAEYSESENSEQVEDDLVGISYDASNKKANKGIVGNRCIKRMREETEVAKDESNSDADEFEHLNCAGGSNFSKFKTTPTKRKINKNMSHDISVNSDKSSSHKKYSDKDLKTIRNAFGEIDDLDFNLDEGYDTVSLNFSREPKDEMKNIPAQTKSENTKTDSSSVISIDTDRLKSSKFNDSNKNDSVLSNVTEQSSSDVTKNNVNISTSPISRILHKEKAVNKLEGGVKKSCVKDRLKKFKFTLKDSHKDAGVSEEGKKKSKNLAT